MDTPDQPLIVARQPLYSPALLGGEDASHDVRAPGGYEWWYFDADDVSTGRQIVAIFLHGFAFHPGYLRAYRRYTHRPKHNRPPVPDDFVCCYFAVYENGAVASQFMSQWPAGEYSASRERPDVRIGVNRMTRDDDGSIVIHLQGAPWTLGARGPVTHRDRVLGATLTFRPLINAPAMERTFLSERLTGAHHQWVIANPMCDVTGQIITGAASEPVVQTFSGRGYHDHNYGDAPIGPGLKRWMWGRVLLRDRVLTFHHVVPRDSGLPMETHLVQGSVDRLTELDPGDVRLDWAGQTSMLLRYPRHVRLGGHLSLDNPRVIDMSPFYLRMKYDADAEGEKSTAFCEVAYPHRLRWPVLGRMIELSIDKR